MNTLRKYLPKTTNDCLVLLGLLLLAVVVYQYRNSDLVEGYQDCPDSPLTYKASAEPTSLNYASVSQAYLLNPRDQSPPDPSVPCWNCPPSWAYPGSQPEPLEMMVGVSTGQCRSFWIV